jgi:hypothetical protein
MAKRNLYEILISAARAGRIAPVSAGQAGALTQWRNLPNDKRSVAAVRGIFSPTKHLLHTIRFISLEVFPGDKHPPYKAMVGNTHQLFVGYKNRREGSLFVILVSLQFEFKAGEKFAQYKTSNWIAREICNRLVMAIESAPDLEVQMLRHIPKDKNEIVGLDGFSKAERHFIAVRDSFWAFQIDKIYRKIMNE